jgi:hypothetical protein
MQQNHWLNALFFSFFCKKEMKGHVHLKKIPLLYLKKNIKLGMTSIPLIKKKNIKCGNGNDDFFV